MSDIYGIGRALLFNALQFFHYTKQSGRTTKLVKLLVDGDRVVCATQAEARYLIGELKLHGKLVEVIVRSSERLDWLGHEFKNSGKTYFDHGWIEKYYLSSMQSQEKYLSSLVDLLSGNHDDKYETTKYKRDSSYEGGEKIGFNTGLLDTRE